MTLEASLSAYERNVKNIESVDEVAVAIESYESSPSDAKLAALTALVALLIASYAREVVESEDFKAAPLKLQAKAVRERLAPGVRRGYGLVVKHSKTMLTKTLSEAGLPYRMPNVELDEDRLKRAVARTINQAEGKTGVRLKPPFLVPLLNW